MQLRNSRFLPGWVVVAMALGCAVAVFHDCTRATSRRQSARNRPLWRPLAAGCAVRMGTIRDYIGEGSSRIIVSPDGRFMTATSSWSKLPLRLWDPETGRVLRELTELDIKGIGVEYGEFSSNGKLIAAADPLGTVRLGDTATGRRIGEYLGHSEIWGIAFSADSKILMIGHGATVWYWDIATGARTHRPALARARTNHVHSFVER